MNIIRKICIMLLCVILCTFSVSAAYESVINGRKDNRKIDSSVIDESIRQELAPQENEVIIRALAFRGVGNAFEVYNSLDIALNGAMFCGVRYIVYDPNQPEEVVYGRMLEADGTWTESIRSETNEAIQAYLDESIIAHVSPNIIVTGKYYLTGEYGAGNSSATAIYYETDMGTYIHVFGTSADPEGVGNGKLLSLVNYRRMLDNPQDYDMSPYDYMSEDFDPDAPLRTTESIFQKKMLIAVAVGVPLILMVILGVQLISQKRRRGGV